MTRKDKWRIFLVVCGALPFIFLSAPWANAALIVYSMTAVLFGILLVGDYPPLGSFWFWKSITALIVFHSLVIFSLAALNLRLPEMNKLPRVLYGLLAFVVIFEWRLSIRIIGAFEARMLGQKPPDGESGTA